MDEKDLSVAMLETKLRQFLPANLMLCQITPQRAAQMYADETVRIGRFGKVRAATHHKVLRSTKAFFSWAVGRGYLKENPFATVKPVGRANAGKPQLRQDEARKLNDLLISRAAEGDERALAVLVSL